jgi:Uma2 family endonuclease
MSPMTLFRRDSQYHTYADYLIWSRDYGDELINGVAYVREPPSPSPLHQEIVGELYRQLANALEGKSGRVCIAPLDVRLPKSGEPDDEVDTVVQPDVFIVCDQRKIDGRGVRGAPDWVAEVLSPGTASYDQTTKLKTYERAGVQEVWLIQPVDKTLTIYRLEDGCYGRPSAFDLEGQTVVAAVDVTVDWDRLLSNIA